MRDKQKSISINTHFDRKRSENFTTSFRSGNELLFSILTWLQQRKQKFFRDVTMGTYVSSCQSHLVAQLNILCSLSGYHKHTTASCSSPSIVHGSCWYRRIKVLYILYVLQDSSFNIIYVHPALTTCVTVVCYIGNMCCMLCRQHVLYAA